MLADGHGNPALGSGNSFGWWVGSQRLRARSPAALVGWKSYRQQMGRKFRWDSCSLSSLPLKGKEGQNMAWCNRRKTQPTLSTVGHYKRFTRGSSGSGQHWSSSNCCLKRFFTVGSHPIKYAATSLPDKAHLEGQEEEESLKITLCFSAPSTDQSGSMTECPLETKGQTLETSELQQSLNMWHNPYNHLVTHTNN